LGWYVDTNISEEYTASIFMLEANFSSKDGYLKSWHPPVKLHNIKTFPEIRSEDISRDGPTW
jgi:hypothetical protein